MHLQHAFLYISLPVFCTTTTWNFQKLPSNTFYGGNVVCVPVHFLFAGAHFHKKERLGFIVVFLSLRPRPNVELFMRRTKLNESISWKFRLMALLISSQEWVWIVQHVLSVSASDGQKLIDLHMRRNKLINLKISPCFCCFVCFYASGCFCLLISFLFLFLIIIIIFILREGLQQVF